jgi:putative membrane protein
MGFVYTLIFTTDSPNWLMENLLSTILMLVVLGLSRRFPLSEAAYLVFFLFLYLHLFGAMYSYAENPLGKILMGIMGSSRNHYDRIVHFSFGLFGAYFLFDFLRNHTLLRAWWLFFLPVELMISVSALFEIVEMVWAQLTYPDLGPAFLGHQGDPWDAQKDILLASTGAFITAGICLLRHRNLLR